MASPEWQLSLKLVDQPKSTFYFPEMMPGDVLPGEYRVATLKQLVAAQLPDSIPDPDLIGWFTHESVWPLDFGSNQSERSCLISELVHCGRKLKDDLTLDACGILSGSTIHVLKKTWPEPESTPGVCLTCAPTFRSRRLFNLNGSTFPSVRAREQSDCSQGVQGVSRCSSLSQLLLQRLGE